MTKTWIFEKDSVAKTFANAALGGIKTRSGVIYHASNGDQIIVTRGSIIENAPPEDYDPTYKSWDKYDICRLIDKQIKTAPAKNRDGTSREADLKTMISVLKNTTNLIIATDAGREGETIAWRLIETSGYNGTVQRLWTSSSTAAGLQAAAAKLLPAAAKKNMYFAGLARSICDFMEGLTGTRFMTRKHMFGKGVLSVGRVQTPLLALINDRCVEIEKFIPRVFFVIVAQVDVNATTVQMTHTRPPATPFKDEDEARDTAVRAIGQRTILKSTTTEKQKEPPNFATTPSIQQAAYKKHKMSATDTSACMQKLYEAGLITYPRTECPFRHTDEIHEMKRKLNEALAIPSIASQLATQPQWLANPTIRTERFDDSKVLDHGAVVPDAPITNNMSLGPEEKKIYELIVHLFVITLLPTHKYLSTKLSGIVDTNEYIAYGKTITEPGWKLLETSDDDDNKKARRQQKTDATDAAAEKIQKIPVIKPGDQGYFKDVIHEGRATKPPLYYDGSTIIDAMCNLDLHLADPRASAIMTGPGGQKKGLGTAATRDVAIEIVQKRGYVDATSGKFIVTPRGRDLIKFVRHELPWLADPLHTVRQEITLTEIEDGTAQHENYISKVRTNMSAHLDRLIKTSGYINAGVSKEITAQPVISGKTKKTPAPGRSATQPKTLRAPRPKLKPNTAASKKPAPAAPNPPQAQQAPPKPDQKLTTTLPVTYDIPAGHSIKARQIGLKYDSTTSKYYADDRQTIEKADKQYKRG